MRVSLEELSYELWVSITSLYLGDPLTHAYLAYDLIYQLPWTRIFFNVSEGSVRGYMLIWRGRRALGVHLWGDAVELVELLPTGSPMIVHLYSQELLDEVVDHLEPYGSVEVRDYVDMAVGEEGFKPYRPSEAIRLGPGHVDMLLDVKRSRGLRVDREEVEEALTTYRYYGVIVDGVLASTACAYLRLPEVWIIGDVYTRPEHRGRGYAKIATSAITRDAVVSGAKALLHVEKGNTPAIAVYRTLGFKALRARPWVFYEPRREP